MEHVNDIINNLCERLGTTIEYIVPEYAKMKIVEGLSEIGICGVILILSLICLFVSYRKYSKFEGSGKLTETEVWNGILIGSAITSLFSILAFIILLTVQIPEILKFYNTPYAAFIEDLIRQVYK